MPVDLLILLAADAPADACWDQSIRIFGREHAGRACESRIIRFNSAELFHAAGPAGAPARDHLIDTIRVRLPSRPIVAIEVALTVTANEDGAAARVAAVFDAFTGVCQVPALLHLFLLVPENPARFSVSIPGIQRVLAAVATKEVRCRDLCWIRMVSPAPSAAPAIPDTLVSAAHHTLWSPMPAARQPFALLEGLALPNRYSVSSRLVFERSVWREYARDYAIGQLTNFLAACRT